MTNSPQIAESVLMAIGAILTVVGTFLPFEKLIVFVHGSTYQTVTFTAIGTKTMTGQPALPALQAGNAGNAGNAGKIILTMGVLLQLAAVLIIAKKGRLWVSILSLVVAAVGVIMYLASFVAPRSIRPRRAI